MVVNTLGSDPRLKIDLMFEGLRYSEALGRSAEHAFPNYSPYHFAPGEANPTGQPKVTIPYLMTTEGGTLVRIKGNPESSWYVEGSSESGHLLVSDKDSVKPRRIRFEPMPNWVKGRTRDGFPMERAGVSLHGDMAVINVAPGCEYFQVKNEEGTALRCTFCTYGAPDIRTRDLGQVRGETSLSRPGLDRMQETLRAALTETEIRHIYLVGGSMTDWEEEGRRFLELARAVQEVSCRRVPVACGSGALPEEILRQFHSEGLVDSVCFNLEVWSEPVFATVCPGKQKFVGYDRWIKSLENAVGLWGQGRVYSAMVAGVELEPEHGDLGWEEAADLAIKGADDLCSRGILPIYSLYWPSAGRDHAKRLRDLRHYFEYLNLAYRDIRHEQGLRIWDGFMCHRCAYMQLECDLDRLVDDPGALQQSGSLGSDKAVASFCSPKLEDLET